MRDAWSTRDCEIVETLARRVRLLALPQLAHGWWRSGTPLRTVRRRLRRLVAAGLLLRATVNAHPLLRVSEPLSAWSAGGPPPDFDTVARQAQSRWSEAAKPHEVYCASPLAANLFGSTAGSLPPLNHRDHDLLLGQVYALYRARRPREAARWIGEDTLPKAGYRIKDPDAFLIDDAGRRERVIESAGRYSADQVESFHEHCREYDLPYELW